MTLRGKIEVRTSFNLKWYEFSQFVFSDCVHWAEENAQDNHTDTNANGEQPSSIPSPRPPPKSKKSQPNLPKPQKPNRDVRGTKRASSEKARPDKRQKKETPDAKGSASEEKEVRRKKPIPKPKKRASPEKTGPKKRRQKEISGLYDSGREEEDFPSKEPVSETRKGTSGSSLSPETESNEESGQSSQDIRGNLKASGGKAEGSESEMSEVLDVVPEAKGRKRKSELEKPSAKKTDTLKRKKSAEKSTDPDAEEIKRLQGWLIKCGIRKTWYRELAPYDNSKAKIRHLKELLADAGMQGRYSTEKASKIKEDRELQADLEAVQAGAKQWGKAETDGEDETSGRPKRRLARGLQELDFLNDDDGEETD